MIGWKKFPKFGFAFSSQGFSSFFEDSLLNDYDFVVSLFVEGISVKNTSSLETSTGLLEDITFDSII